LTKTKNAFTIQKAHLSALLGGDSDADLRADLLAKLVAYLSADLLAV
jgi:hypothetical protein